MESLQVLHAIRDNIPLNQVADIDSRQKLLSADSLTNLFSNRFPQAVDNLRDLVAGISYQLNTDLKLRVLIVTDLQWKNYTSDPIKD